MMLQSEMMMPQDNYIYKNFELNESMLRNYEKVSPEDNFFSKNAALNKDNSIIKNIGGGYAIIFTFSGKNQHEKMKLKCNEESEYINQFKNTNHKILRIVTVFPDFYLVLRFCIIPKKLLKFLKKNVPDSIDTINNNLSCLDYDYYKDKDFYFLLKIKDEHREELYNLVCRELLSESKAFSYKNKLGSIPCNSKFQKYEEDLNNDNILYDVRKGCIKTNDSFVLERINQGILSELIESTSLKNQANIHTVLLYIDPKYIHPNKHSNEEKDLKHEKQSCSCDSNLNFNTTNVINVSFGYETNKFFYTTNNILTHIALNIKPNQLGSLKSIQFIKFGIDKIFVRILNLITSNSPSLEEVYLVLHKKSIRYSSGFYLLSKLNIENKIKIKIIKDIFGKKCLNIDEINCIYLINSHYLSIRECNDRHGVTSELDHKKSIACLTLLCRDKERCN